MSEKVITIDGVSYELRFERDGAVFESGEQKIEVVSIGPSEALIRAGGRTHRVPFVVDGFEVSLIFDGEIYRADVADKGARTRAKHRDQSMSAPMPGVVLKVLVVPGAPVEKGTPLLILEAMKMEHTILAAREGKVTAIHCREGELVQPGVELVELESPAE